MEEIYDVEEFFPLVDEAHCGREAELRSRVETYDAMNEFNMGSVLGLTDDDISGSKIVGGFTDYVKLMIKNTVLTTL